jgi:formylglycine-generating enzyme required for sulfatase activity
MGSSQEEIDRAIGFKVGWRGPEYFQAEGPEHDVEITQPFYMSIHEVTLGQFRNFVEATGHQTEIEQKGGAIAIRPKQGQPIMRNANISWQWPGFRQKPDHPVVFVTWSDAKAFCAWLGNLDGKQYDLPTEAQWEYACRAGSKSRFSTGDSDDSLEGHANLYDASRVANEGQDFGARHAVRWNDEHTWTSPVGQFKANAFGLHDMHGNVREWCLDKYDPNYYRESPARDPSGPPRGNGHVIRGGSYRSPPLDCRSASRSNYVELIHGNSTGFRVICRP